MAISYLSSMSIDGTLTLTVNADADSTYTGIVVSESGLLKYRTKAQIKSDIGAGSGDGSVTSVGLSIDTDDALAVAASSTPVTGSGTLELEWQGDSSEVVLGSGELATLPTSDTGVPAILSDGTSPTLNSGITALEVRTLIGAGTGSGNVTTSGLTSGRVPFATSGTNIEDQGNFTYNNSTKVLDVNGLIQGAALSSENTRVSTSQQFPVGHYSSGEVVWEMDPTWSDKQLQDYFDSSDVSWVEVADAPGGWCIYIDGSVNVGGAYNSGYPFIPVETDSEDGDFYMECYIQNVGNNQQHYMGSTDFNESFGSLGGNPGSYGYFVMSNTNPGQSWTKVSGYIGGFDATQTGKFELGTKYWTPMALFNYGAGTGTRACRISGWKVIKTQRSEAIYKFPGSIRTPKVESSSTLLLDATDDITIDAGGGDIILSDDATIFGTISSSGGMQIRSRVNNADMFFRGVDNNLEFDALTLDMSNGGSATFADDIDLAGKVTQTGTNANSFGGSVGAATFNSTTQDAANIFKGSVISSPSSNALGLILRNSSDNAVIGSLLRTSASTSALTTDTLNLPGTTSQYIRGDGSAATFPSSSGISGSGTSGKVAKFTGSTSIGDGDITFGTNTITLGDPTSSSTATLFVDTQNRRVGYRTINPTSAFEVVGTINTQGLNCNEQQFFVDKDNTYIKAAAYGGGEFFGMTGSENQPKYTYAAGSGGKFVEDQRIETVKIEQNGFYNWFTNGCVLIPAQGTNTFILVDEITVYKSAGSNPTLGTVYFGFCQQASPTSNCQMFGNNKSFDFWGSIPSQVVTRTGTWIWQSNSPSRSSVIENADTASLLNRPFVGRMGSGGEVSSGTFNGPWYIQIKYRNVNYIAGFQNNVDRTVTSTGSGGGTSRTAFLGSSVTNFSTICPGSANIPPDANQSYHFDNSSSCNGNNGYPASGDIVYTSATGSTVAAAGYIFLYSGGGKRFYLQIGGSGVVQGSSCTDSVNECDQPDS